MSESVCIIGGGATGAALLWCLAQDEQARANTEVTLIHSGPALGGHSLTFQYNPHDGGPTLPVDVGVQLISPMVYANVRLMLGLDQFSQSVPMTDYDTLDIACAFPDDANGNPQNWANFPAYQEAPLFSLYSPAMRAASTTFESFMEIAVALGWAGKSVQEYFDSNPPGYGSTQLMNEWIDYFLWPYLSIINGYGAALMDQTLVGDLIPFFMSLPRLKSPLGSFTQPGTGWQRFTNGAQSWVQAMADVAQSMQYSEILLNSTVTGITNAASGDTRPVVDWTDGDGAQQSQIFDKVVLTLDMQTNASILSGRPDWQSVYEPHIDPSFWSLQPGACYIHTDPSVLSPRLRGAGFEQETLQFTAYYAPQSAYPYYDLYNTYTTYLQANLLGTTRAAGVYNTMYGYDPTTQPGVPMPDPDSVLYSQTWMHSKLAPSFAAGAKKVLYQVQSPGFAANPYSGQPANGIYFAGNNTTYDSEDGALEAAMIIASYAFGVTYPFASAPADLDYLLSHALGAFLYATYYEIMFPGMSPSHPTNHHVFSLIADAMKHAVG